MKQIIYRMTFLAGMLLLSGSVAYAGDHHGAKALEHAAVAASHAERGHLKLIIEHSREALHHAKMAADEHHEKQMHMRKAVEALNEAVKHANKKHSDLASKAAHRALEHIHKTF